MEPRNQSPDFDDEEEQVNVYLKVIKTLAIKVKRTDTIGNIKSLFCDKEGISESLQELFFNGDQLKDDKKVIDCGIQEDSTLHMIVQNSVRVKLSVIIPSHQKSIVVEARTYDTVQNIKAVILQKEGILPHEYNLVYAGEMLEDDRTLASLNMQCGLALLLVFNPKDVLSFSVISPTGEIVRLKAKFLYSVSQVKAIAGSLIGVPISDYDLIYKGEKLEDSNSLACYNIQEESVLEMSPQIFQVFVKTWSGKTITLDVRRCDTVEEVKDKIFKKLGGPKYCYSIIFAGKRLADHNNLAHYSINKHATIYMVFSPSTITTKMKLSEIGGPALGVPNPGTRIRDLKTLIQKKIPTPVKEVYFRGIPLQDECSIDSYSIGIHDRLTIASEGRW